MKRLLIALLCAALLLAAGYASTAVEPEGAEYQVYFRVADIAAGAGSDALRAETVRLEENLSRQALMEQLLELLLQGPQEGTLQSVLPQGTSLLSVQQRGPWITVDFSRPYSTLSGISLTLADYAVTQTLTQLPDVAMVRITVEGRELAYRSHQFFSTRELVYATTEDIVGSVTATLYYLDGEGELRGVEQELNLYEGDTQTGVVVRALETSPNSRELISVIPSDFRVRTVWQDEDVCYVNLSSLQIEALEDGAVPDVIWQALEGSLLLLDGVEEVCFLVDGERAEFWPPPPAGETAPEVVEYCSPD